MYRLMKTLVLLKSNPVVHMLFLIMNIVAIGEEQQDFFSINLAHIPDLIQPEPIPRKMRPWPLCALVFLFYICVNLREKIFPLYRKILKSEHET